MTEDNEEHKGAFWPSYVDIMTTLFAIMLVLFGVTFSHFKSVQGEFQKTQDSLNAYVRDYKELLSIYEIVENIDTTYFEFRKEYVKHIFRLNVTYQTGQYELDKLQADKTNPAEAERIRDKVYEAGKVIENTIVKLQQNDSIKQDIKYLVVIEGQASKDGYTNNDMLSYLRALKLSEYWKSRDIDFRVMDKCELVISGSGEGGVPRDSTNEKNNQRFLIHIVPVIGNVHR